jgi:predicted 3-demethylubiquinone-9 3-methyltransferase (glyoxalase superfamily)
MKDSGPNLDMDVMVVDFNLSGQDFMAFNGGPLFKFNESVSFVIDCDGQEEVDYYWQKLTADGGQESQCGWLKDKFGLSWQVVPKQLGQLMSDPDKVKANKVMQAMLKMQKIVISDLEKAGDN